MKVTLIRRDGNKDVLTRIELTNVANSIQNGLALEHVRKLREQYHLMKPQRQEDGSIVTRMEGGIKLPLFCFAAAYENRKGERRMLEYNGLV